jgi:tripartite-type tricarboxylate transporter receptor subunit TctC
MLGAALTVPHAVPATYPSRPIRMLVGFSAGGSVDSAARIVADGLSKRLGQQVLVDNRPGVSGLLAADLVAKAEPDGHTLLFSSNGALTITPHLVAKPPFDPLTDLAPVARIARVDAVLVVNPDVPANNIKEFTALLRRQPGKYSFASSGTGGPTHLAGELFKSSGGLDMVHVPYKGDAPAMVDVISGVVPVAIPVIPSAEKFIKSGRVRALASFGEQRSATFPDLPTLAESGFPGVTGGAWYAVLAPARTPAPIVGKIGDALTSVLADPQIVLRMQAAGTVPWPAANAQETGAYIRREYEKWGTVVRDAKIPISIN